MLPNSRDFANFNNPFKFADLAIPALVAEMRVLGARSLAARLVGGARMFPNGASRSGFDIGERNALQARVILSSFIIPVVAEDVGGSVGRTVLVDVSLGSVRVRTAGRGERNL